MSKLLCEPPFLFCWNNTQQCNCQVVAYWGFYEHPKSFPELLYGFYIPSSNVCMIYFLHILSLFFILAALTGVYWCFIVVLIGISLIANDAEHLFICLFAICVPSSVKYLFRSFAHFLNRFSFFLLSFEISFYILDTSPQLDTWEQIVSPIS